ncbi:hypothetical protein Tco_1102777 [Tanacetum coccineum]
MNFSVFNCTEEDSVGKPLYSRFIKTNDFKGVPHPLSGDYTPKPQEEIDESLYVYGKKGPQEPEPSVSDDRSSEYSTCQSNDSAGSIGTSSEHSVDLESEISRVPQEVYVSKPITTNEKGVSAPKSKENAMMERELGEGYSFTKKKCFVCGSLSHLIKDCDYYEKKMAREAEFKKQRVFNTGNRVAKPVWTNADRINHANQFVPRPVQLNAGRPNINSVRPNINTGRTNINFVRPRVNTVNSNVNTVRSRQPVPTRTSNSFSPKRPQVNHFNQRRHFFKSHSSVRRPFAKNTAQMSHSHAVKGNWGSAVKTSAGNQGSTEDFEEFNRGSVTFGGSKGYITGKGKIRVGNLDFDSVSFVKELGHFNLFSISKICDKQHKNGVDERMNRTLIEAARTMLEDSLLPTTFRAEAVSTAMLISLIGYFTNLSKCKLTSEENDKESELIVGAFRSYPLKSKSVPQDLPTLRIHKYFTRKVKYLDPKSAVETRIDKQCSTNRSSCTFQQYSKAAKKQSQKRSTNLLSLPCFLSQEEPKNISEALQQGDNWVSSHAKRRLLQGL